MAARSVRMAALLLIALAPPPCGAGEPREARPSLMPAWRLMRTAPILQYYWPGNASDAERRERFADYRAMGFTGIYKIDKEPPQGGRLFLDGGLHGHLFQTNFANAGEPVIGDDGRPAVFRGKHPFCRSVFSPRNAAAYYESVVKRAKAYGPENLFRAGGTVLMTSWDETGLYSRSRIEYGYGAREEFAAFLKDRVFLEPRPDADGNGDGRTFNAETGLSIADWGAVPLPPAVSRYERPALWKLWIEFHAYYTYLFFKRGGLHASAALGGDVELAAFSHGSVIWPGSSSWRGLDNYWAARLNRMLTVEMCQGDYPGSTIGYAFTNQVSRRYGAPVMGWSWFSPDPGRANTAGPVSRALARTVGHATHGLFFWVYDQQAWARKPAAREAISFWHRTYQAHWPFLRDAAPPAPKVAVVFPRNTGNMYPDWSYPKLDYGWTCQALSEMQIPFEVVSDHQVEREADALDGYRALLIPSAAWESPLFRARVAAFIAKGGCVYADGDSFARDTGGGDGGSAFLAEQFGVRLRGKHKTVWAPTFDSAAEEAWAAKTARWQSAVWEGDRDRAKFRTAGEGVEPLSMGDADFDDLRTSLPSVSGTGVPQTLLDPRLPHMVEGLPSGGVPAAYRTYHDIVTADAAAGTTVLARYRGEACAVERARTVWTGFRPGHDLAVLFPVRAMREWGEPVWPFEINRATTAAERAPCVAWLRRVVEKAGVSPDAAVLSRGLPAPDIEALVREDRRGNALIVLIDHEPGGGPYEMRSARLTRAALSAELLTGARLRVKGGAAAVSFDGDGVALVACGSEQFVRERLAAQRSVRRDVAPVPAAFAAGK